MAQIQHVNVSMICFKEFDQKVTDNITFSLQLLTVIHLQSWQIPLYRALPQPLDPQPSTAVIQGMN